MDKLVLNATTRKRLGTGGAKALRKENRVPAVIAAKHLEDSIHISLDGKDVSKLLRENHAGSTLYLNVDSVDRHVVIKGYQTEPLTNRILHVDFQELMKGAKVRVTIPIILNGKEDLKDVYCQELISEVEIEATPENLIDRVEIELGNAKYGDQLTIGELDLFKTGKLEAITDPDSIIYIISEIGEEVEEETDEEDVMTEPEVITAGHSSEEE